MKFIFAMLLIALSATELLALGIEDNRVIEPVENYTTGSEEDSFGTQCISNEPFKTKKDEYVELSRSYFCWCLRYQPPYGETPKQCGGNEEVEFPEYSDLIHANVRYPEEVMAGIRKQLAFAQAGLYPEEAAIEPLNLAVDDRNLRESTVEQSDVSPVWCEGEGCTGRFDYRWRDIRESDILRANSPLNDRYHPDYQGAQSEIPDPYPDGAFPKQYYYGESGVGLSIGDVVNQGLAQTGDISYVPRNGTTPLPSYRYMPTEMSAVNSELRESQSAIRSAVTALAGSGPTGSPITNVRSFGNRAGALMRGFLP